MLSPVLHFSLPNNVSVVIRYRCWAEERSVSTSILVVAVEFQVIGSCSAQGVF